MINLSNKELCLLYLMVTEVLNRCKESQISLEYPSANVENFKKISKKLLDGINHNSCEQTCGRFEPKKFTLAEEAIYCVPYVLDIREYNNDLVSKKTASCVYNITLSFIDDSILTFNVNIPNCELYDNILLLNTVLKYFDKWEDKISHR